MPVCVRLATFLASGENRPRNSGAGGGVAGTFSALPTDARLPPLQVSDARNCAPPPDDQTSCVSSAENAGASPGPSRCGTPPFVLTIQTSASGGSGSDVGFDVAPHTNATA